MTSALQTRLGLGLALSLAIVLGVQWLAVSAAIRYAVENQMQTRLRHDSEMLLALVRTGAGGRPEFAFDAMSPIYRQPFSGHYYRVEAGGEVARSRSLWDEELQVPAALAGGDGGSGEAPGPAGQQLLLVVKTYQKNEGPVRIAVAEDVTPLNREIRRLQYLYAALSLLFFGFLLGLQVVLLRRNLAPLQALRAQVRQLEQGMQVTLSENVPAEVVPLVREINHLLAVLGERLQRSRTAVGNLAHALKAPLTLLGQQAERPGLAALPELRAQLRQRVTEIRGLIERELKRARIAGAGSGRAAASLAQDVGDLMATLEAIYRDRQLRFKVELPEAPRCPMEREDLLELLGNLLDNACKWAATTVALAIRRDDGWQFRVEDDGPGADAATYARLLQRGTRLDESTGGHGLGLAIVQDIVSAYGGRLTLQRSSSLGGFAAIVSLPLNG